MAYSEEKKNEVYNKLARMGFDPHFCQLISEQMCTEWTAMRMLGYLRQAGRVSPEDVVDEMLAIQSDRDRIRQKHEMEFYQGKVNEIYNHGLD